MACASLPSFLRMILSENRTPLFGIMRCGGANESNKARALMRREKKFFDLAPPNSGTPEFGDISERSRKHPTSGAGRG